MAVNYILPQVQDLLPVAGVRIGVAEAGIRKANRKDLTVFLIDEGAAVGAVFTRNRYAAAPVQVGREHLAAAGAGIRALVVNTGCANAGTGAAGIVAARATCAGLARLIGCAPSEVLPFSTGVIMEPLPVERLTAGLPACLAGLKADNWAAAAEAIMTTDTVPKAVSRRVTVGGVPVTITGIAKGAGMIRPDMATMLGFVACDARVTPEVANAAVAHAARRSFNCITVDGDTSTNDSFMLIATGRAGMPEIAAPRGAAWRALVEGITEVAAHLAQAIVRDGEGATKFITVRVERGRSVAECRRAAYAIAHSPLVKTAFFASDPNLGRILAAVGNAGIADLASDRVDLYLDDVLVATGGGRAPAYREEDGQRVMRQAELTVRVVLNRGTAAATVWTCDLSHDYVTINAEYRT